jgi:HTH-type transcriptional regulator / antitoxin HigA
MIKKIQNEWHPTDVSLPGDTLAEELEVRGMTPSDLAEQMGFSLMTVTGIINGDDAITPEIATQLERVFGVSATFWNNRERRYRESLAKKQVATVAAGA